MSHSPNPSRYQKMQYNRCGNSGLKLPAISLGLWHNFGDVTLYDISRDMALLAFDLGITQFDLDNNYGPPGGSAELNFGRIMREDLAPYRDELIISTKAGYGMWEGPYGDWGSKKYLVSSLDQSLKRMGLDYVDIFYHHRPDPDTPLEETMGTLDLMVRQGKALYVGISNYYDPMEASRAIEILKDLGTPCLINQVKFNMLDRSMDNGLNETLIESGVGCITFSPLEKGLLTDRYLHGIPEDSRMASGSPFLQKGELTDERLGKLRALNAIADMRGQSLAQMALAWNLQRPEVTSVLIGASKVDQIEDCVKAQENTRFTKKELEEIDGLCR
ncbi:MAG: aldo/keto reductase [Spirochaetaceae bacterium]|jgi:L-glyceraldehyde 3-phosphate reductase|nr:aldo/keto reductase [Spirochaetaceae bacterium]